MHEVSTEVRPQSPAFTGTDSYPGSTRRHHHHNHNLHCRKSVSATASPVSFASGSSGPSFPPSSLLEKRAAEKVEIASHPERSSSERAGKLTAFQRPGVESTTDCSTAMVGWHSHIVMSDSHHARMPTEAMAYEQQQMARHQQPKGGQHMAGYGRRLVTPLKPDTAAAHLPCSRPCGLVASSSSSADSHSHSLSKPREAKGVMNCKEGSPASAKLPLRRSFHSADDLPKSRNHPSQLQQQQLQRQYELYRACSIASRRGSVVEPAYSQSPPPSSLDASLMGMADTAGAPSSNGSMMANSYRSMCIPVEPPISPQTAPSSATNSSPRAGAGPLATLVLTKRAAGTPTDKSTNNNSGASTGAGATAAAASASTSTAGAVAPLSPCLGPAVIANASILSILTPLPAPSESFLAPAAPSTTLPARYRPPSPPRRSHSSANHNASTDAMDSLTSSGDARKVHFSIPPIRQPPSRRPSSGAGLNFSAQQLQQRPQAQSQWPPEGQSRTSPSFAVNRGPVCPAASPMANGLTACREVVVPAASAHSSVSPPPLDHLRTVPPLFNSSTDSSNEGGGLFPRPLPNRVSVAVNSPTITTTSTAATAAAVASGSSAPSDKTSPVSHGSGVTAASAAVAASSDSSPSAMQPCIPLLSLRVCRQGNRNVIQVAPAAASSSSYSLGTTSRSSAAHELATYSPQMHPLKPALRQCSRYNTSNRSTSFATVAGAPGAGAMRRVQARAMAAAPRFDPRIMRSLQDACHSLVNPEIAKHVLLLALLLLGCVLVLLV